MNAIEETKKLLDGLGIQSNEEVQQDLEKLLKKEGVRLDKEKIRHDLISGNAINELAKVLTFGARKYDANNWRLGMKWSRVLGSMERHLNAIKRGEDRDPETGLLHASHVMCNAMFLTDYYSIFPQGDDRPHEYLKPRRIGLDIDDVLADWIGTFCALAKVPIPTSWHFGFLIKIKDLTDRGLDYDEVMKNLPVKTSPSDIHFEPTCYITHREHCDVSIAEEWLAKNGFPQVPVIQTKDKLKACKDMNLDIFVDDKFETFANLNREGVFCYLFDTPWNRKYNVGYKRIFNLNELS